jgi:hypothetical protein
MTSPGKGDFGGECNHRGCDALNARYWDRRRHAYYCEACARQIELFPTEITSPQRFDWPLTADTTDRRKLKSELRFRKANPHHQTEE